MLVIIHWRIDNIFNEVIYKDVYVRYTTQRFLFGPDFWIYEYDKMGKYDNLIILSEKDKMVPSLELYNRFVKNNILCMVVNDAYHAEIFTSDKYIDVLDKIRLYLEHYKNLSKN